VGHAAFVRSGAGHRDRRLAQCRVAAGIGRGVGDRVDAPAARAAALASEQELAVVGAEGRPWMSPGWSPSPRPLSGLVARDRDDGSSAWHRRCRWPRASPSPGAQWHQSATDLGRWQVQRAFSTKADMTPERGRSSTRRRRPSRPWHGARESRDDGNDSPQRHCSIDTCHRDGQGSAPDPSAADIHDRPEG